MKASPLGRADDRPRIHIWPHPEGAAWSRGPNGHRSLGETPGDALDKALAALSRPGAYVVIGEPQP